MYDFIGDIHGYATELHQLLELMGYVRTDRGFGHPTRKAVFVGDFIDRGPEIRQVLQTVRNMVETGAAWAVMGNHELNALGFHTRNRHEPREFLRPHLPKNVNQHRATLEQLDANELAAALEWFKTLPLWIDVDGFRVVHACWNKPAVDVIDRVLRQLGGITEEFLQAAFLDPDVLAAVEVVLKGPEIALPTGIRLTDKDGHVRDKTRIKWYVTPTVETTLGEYSLTDDVDCGLRLGPDAIAAAHPYPTGQKPVFIGHYWLRAPRPSLLAPNVACVDFSVAKRGLLSAYRWSGEPLLKNENFVWVAARQ